LRFSRIEAQIVDQGENPLRSEQPIDREILDYAHPEKSPRHGKEPISGIISIIAMLVQVPWAFFIYFTAILPQVGGPAIAAPIVVLIVILALAPSIVSLACGWYSIRIAGVTSRNICGVAGVILVAFEVIWFGGYWLSMLAATEGLGALAVPLIICFVAGIVVLVSWALLKSR
jgi:hypothetical protein